jgi:hypothetical protein
MCGERENSLIICELAFKIDVMKIGTRISTAKHKAMRLQHSHSVYTYYESFIT